MQNITTRQLIILALTGWGLLFVGALFTLQNWTMAQEILYLGLGMIGLSAVLAMVVLLLGKKK